MPHGMYIGQMHTDDRFSVRYLDMHNLDTVLARLDAIHAHVYDGDTAGLVADLAAGDWEYLDPAVDRETVSHIDVSAPVTPGLGVMLELDEELRTGAARRDLHRLGGQWALLIYPHSGLVWIYDLTRPIDVRPRRHLLARPDRERR